MKKTSLLKKFALGITLLLCATTMSARDIFVSQNAGSQGLGTLESPTRLVQALITNVVNDGDRIIVMDNIILNSTLNIDGKSITIEGMFCFENPNDESDAASIDGASAGRIFNITGDGNVTISNLVFKNATNKAIQIDGTDGELIVKIGFCMFKNNSTADPSTDGPDNGAGVTVVGGAMVNIFSCWFIENQAYRGGAIFVNGSTVKIEFSDFSRNYARKRNLLSNSGDLDNNSAGGAIAAAEAYDVTIDYCGFRGNYSHTRGGACFPYGEGTFLVQNSYFIANYSGSPRKDFIEGNDGAPVFQPQGDNNGGAFLIYGAGEVILVNTSIISNVAYGDARGGAIHHESAATLRLINCTVTNNRSDEGNSYHTGGISALQGAQVFISNSIVERNVAGASNVWSDVSLFGGARLDAKRSVTGATQVEVVTNWDRDAETKSYGIDIENNDGVGDFMNESGLDLEGGFSYNCWPLEQGAYATTLGNPEFLFNFGITFDQNNNPRAESGPIYAGAVEITAPAEGSYVFWDDILSEKPSEYKGYGCGTIGIYNPFVDANADAVIVGYYTMLGQKLDKEPASGMFIVKYSNGKSVKVVKK